MKPFPRRFRQEFEPVSVWVTLRSCLYMMLKRGQWWWPTEHPKFVEVMPDDPGYADAQFEERVIFTDRPSVVVKLHEIPR